MAFILQVISLTLIMKLEFSTGQSDIYTPGASGSKVVNKAVKKVEATLGGTNELLERTAFVESMHGKHPNTYRDGYHGGIWQVDEIGFKDTQDVRSHPGLTAKFAKIERDFGIDWSKVKYEDLRKPLYSAIAARLKYSNVESAIPPSNQLYKQAEYWKKYYNTQSGKGTVKKFVYRILSRERC
jgi:receptor-type tyrosine-protein phosphatase Q